MTRLVRKHPVPVAPSGNPTRGALQTASGDHYEMRGIDRLRARDHRIYRVKVATVSLACTVTAVVWLVRVGSSLIQGDAGSSGQVFANTSRALGIAALVLSAATLPVGLIVGRRPPSEFGRRQSWPGRARDGVDAKRGHGEGERVKGGYAMA